MSQIYVDSFTSTAPAHAWRSECGIETLQNIIAIAHQTDKIKSNSLVQLVPQTNEI